MSPEPAWGPSSPRRREQCQACGADGRPGQLICLACGERMALRPAPPSWRPAALAATAMVLTAGIALGLVISAASGGDKGSAAASARGETSAAATRQNELTERRRPAEPQPALVRARAERAHRQSRERARRALARSVGGWPAGRSGYTVLLMSSDEQAARSFAEQVRAAGFDAGVLSAAEHPSLGGTLFTVFSGIYATQAEAVATATRVRASYPRAYTQFVEAPTDPNSAPPAQPLPE